MSMANDRSVNGNTIHTEEHRAVCSHGTKEKIPWNFYFKGFDIIWGIYGKRTKQAKKEKECDKITRGMIRGNVISEELDCNCYLKEMDCYEKVS